MLYDRNASFAFSEEQSVLKWIERVTLAVGFSLVIVPISTFFLNVFLSIGNTLLDSIAVSAFPSILGVASYWMKKKRIVDWIIDKFRGSNS